MITQTSNTVHSTKRQSRLTVPTTISDLSMDIRFYYIPRIYQSDHIYACFYTFATPATSHPISSILSSKCISLNNSAPLHSTTTLHPNPSDSTLHLPDFSHMYKCHLFMCTIWIFHLLHSPFLFPFPSSFSTALSKFSQLSHTTHKDKQHDRIKHSLWPSCFRYCCTTNWAPVRSESNQIKSNLLSWRNG